MNNKTLANAIRFLSLDAVNNGVTGVAIVDARVRHACLFEIFSDKGAGTIIRK